MEFRSNLSKRKQFKYFDTYELKLRCVSFRCRHPDEGQERNLHVRWHLCFIVPFVRADAGLRQHDAQEFG